MHDIMIDLETMGTSADAAIVALGAQAFDLSTGQLGDRFYCAIDLQTAVAMGGVIDAGTVLWWLSQEEEARKALTRDTRPIGQVLAAFDVWCLQQGRPDDLDVWGNGADFDNVILASAYRRAKMPLPWSHWNNRCYRTIKAQHRNIKIERSGTHHNALDDATSQARHLVAMLLPAEVQTPATLSEDELQVLVHTLTGSERAYASRNYFAAGPGHPDMPTLLRLIDKGLMHLGKPIDSTGSQYFHCTQMGAAAVGLELPKSSGANGPDLSEVQA